MVNADRRGSSAARERRGRAKLIGILSHRCFDRSRRIAQFFSLDDTLPRSVHGSIQRRTKSCNVPPRFFNHLEALIKLSGYVMARLQNPRCLIAADKSTDFARDGSESL